jgi:hypothetical protein
VPHSVQYGSSVIVRDECVYHCVHAIFDRGETTLRAVSIHVPYGSSARNENQAVQSGMRLKCSLRTFANRACAFARSHISKPTYMKGPPAVFSATCCRFLARSDPTEALRRRLNSAQHLSCNDIAGTMSTSRAGSPRLAIASIAASRTLQSLSDTTFASAWPLAGPGRRLSRAIYLRWGPGCTSTRGPARQTHGCAYG